MKREDLFTKLHGQYNTYPSPIQDPNAFHHDIFEISHKADSAAEFHHLARDRKQQRLRELNDALDSASFEIIANPRLIGTPHWQHAVQLFRTNSLDSLVRYFASYLPTDLSDTPARDRPVERNRTANTVAPAVAFSFSEPSLKRFPPRESRSPIGLGEEMTQPGNDMSMMPGSGALETEECGNEAISNKRIHPEKSLPAKRLTKQVEFGSSHSQTGRHVHCQGIVQPMALTSSTTATLASGPWRTTITSANSIRSTNGARTGDKRKRA
ncbi:hypothetical protein B0T10DRAFT_493076 [Thelonectria olida]|uniref:Uncharacterized protein n=1 Tax=Thelonectria olida TaxID=1576542 RepID=A0A9P9AMK3_9HYPO|nr:hypothetical protein B0T10DRAFT_493076 [Thelonectria olida]